MRKHKSVVAILLAVMMIFTFMPAMAFADTATSGGVIWEDDFSAATYGGTAVNISRVFRSDGMVAATAYRDDLPANVNNTVYYYDFANASVAIDDTYTNAGYKALETTTIYPTIVFSKPSNATSEVSGQTTVSKAGNALNNWTVKYDVDETLNNAETVSASVGFTYEAANEQTGISVSAAKKFGSLAGKTVSVLGVTTTSVQYFYEINATTGDKDPVGTKEDNVQTLNTTYDGTTHTFSIDGKSGYNMTVYKYDASNGAWNTVDASSLSYSDKTTSAKYKAVYKQASLDVAVSPSQFTQYLNVTIGNSANTPSAYWTEPNAEKSTNMFPRPDYYIISNKYFELTEEQAADPAAFVEIYNGFESAAAEKADAEELKAVFNELYEVKVTKNTIDSNQQTWSVEPKTTGNEWTKALAATKAAHKDLFNKYNLENGMSISYVTGERSMKVVVKPSTPVANDKEDDISFEGQTKYVYSGKKTTKKGVLKAKKTITVNATADSGNAMTFTATKTTSNKITVNASTGKITVKKGLKKGTYKVTVKAKTAAGNGFKACKATQTYTIVIKK